MRYTLREIAASIPPEKKAQDSLWTRLVLRPLSLPFTWIALKGGLRANTVSYLSAVFSIGGGVLFSLGGFALPLWGLLCFFVFSILDCADGNVARVTGTAGPWGGWADAVMGFVAYTAAFLSAGVYEYLRSGFWPALLLAALASSANLLTRVAYQIYKNIEGEAAHGSVSFERMLAENTGITGFLFPAMLVCHIFGGMIGVIGFNFLFYTGGCCLTIFKLAGKAR
jgi:phosphatidylglycerophosphate synthase